MRAKSTAIRFRHIVACALGCTLALPIPGALRASINFPDPLPLSPLEARMLADPANGQFQHFSLIRAALVASGVDCDAELEPYRRKYCEWCDEAERTCRDEATPIRRAAVLFEFIHREILTGGYDARATELTNPFADGKFNCASATVLFTALATDCGLTVYAIERPRHAMCVVEIEGERISVETTCPNWFQLTTAMRREAELTALARSAVGDHPANRREICPAALVAVIYYNRGVDLLHEQRFAEAVSVNVRALRLDPDNETALGNLLASINNWALARCAAGEFPEAVDLLTRGLNIAPDHEPFHANQRHVYRTWIQALAAAGHIDEAMQVLAAARRADPGSPIWNVWTVRLSR